jgi:hypothetical protein
MKIVFLLLSLVSIAACVPEKAEEQRVNSLIQREMELHNERSKGWGE